MFITAFKNVISHMKTNLTTFSFLFIFVMTVLSFVVPIDLSGGDTQNVFRIIIAGMLTISATIFFVGYLCELEILMWKTIYKERSILSIFVKYTDQKYHVYANLATITVIPIILFIVFVAITHIVLPIMLASIFIAMCTTISIP